MCHLKKGILGSALQLLCSGQQRSTVTEDAGVLFASASLKGCGWPHSEWDHQGPVLFGEHACSRMVSPGRCSWAVREGSDVRVSDCSSHSGISSINLLPDWNLGHWYKSTELPSSLWVLKFCLLQLCLTRRPRMVREAQQAVTAGLVTVLCRWVLNAAQGNS